MIVHIIYRDKFTNAYINFMHSYMFEFEQYFIVLDNENKFDINNDIEFYLIQNKSDILLNKYIRKLLNKAEKIIVSGVFDLEKISFILPQAITSKMYLHFWGGDFYSYRECRGLKKKIKNLLMRKFIKKCKAVITLVEDDYNELCKVFPNKNKHFIAPMPADPNEKIDYDFYRKRVKQDNGLCRILVGNSATVENQHKEVFNMLEKFKGENIEIICPLSYGDEQYRDEVVKIGKELFKNKFVPSIDFMSKEKYVELLSTCDIGIFNNNRQQALGNISILLKLDKKIFIRDDTSMWKYFVEKDIKLNCINEIKQMDFHSFVHYDKEIYEANRIIKNSMVKNDAINQWNIIFRD